MIGEQNTNINKKGAPESPGPLHLWAIVTAGMDLREADPSPPFANSATGFGMTAGKEKAGPSAAFGMTIEDAGRKEGSRFLTPPNCVGFGMTGLCR